jgi:hypothetical protein
LRRSLTTGAPEASALFYQSAVTTATAEMVSGEAVTGNYFQMLGLAPAKGRLIQAADEASSARVAVISYTLWRARLAADPNVIGTPIRIGGQPFEIIGIAPEGFDGLSIRFQTPSSVWIPLSAERGVLRERTGVCRRGRSAQAATLGARASCRWEVRARALRRSSGRRRAA